jgi:hypothetical protein
MNPFKRSKTPSPVLTGQVLLLIDWDNLWYSLMSRFGVGEMNIENRIQTLMDWTKESVGELCGGHGFVFAPEHLSLLHRQIFVDRGLKLMTCTKLHLKEPRLNPKSQKMESEIDTVDETIIWFAKMMVGHQNFKTLCLVSGDNDYLPLFEEMRKLGIKRALVAPTIDSLAKNKKFIKCVDENPVTKKRMLLILDKI